MFEQTSGDRRLRNGFLLASAIAWVLLLLSPPGTLHSCPALGTMSRGRSLTMLVAMNPPGRLAEGWLLMLVAMMGPLLISHASYVRQRSIPRRRVQAVALFIAGYGLLWMAVGAVLSAVMLAVHWLGLGFHVSLMGGALIALVWQFSPIKQHCVNRCHSAPRLAPFGLRADVDALTQGIVHGFWCAGSCWALMMVPMLLPTEHNASMGLVALLMFGERLEAPALPSWRLRGPDRLLRLLVAQVPKGSSRSLFPVADRRNTQS